MGDERGQSLAEVIIAATVGILVVSALTFATIYSLRNATYAKTAAQATKLAQEGIETVRSGRDRSSAITGNFQIGGNTITSWNGDSSETGAIWNYQISGNCGDSAATPPTYCYFNIDNSNDNYGRLQYLTAAPSIPSGVEPIGQFKRVVILSDNSSTVRLPDGTTVPSYQVQKTVTVIVRWTDFASTRESKLVTILRKL